MQKSLNSDAASAEALQRCIMKLEPGSLGSRIMRELCLYVMRTIEREAQELPSMQERRRGKKNTEHKVIGLSGQ